MPSSQRSLEATTAEPSTGGVHVSVVVTRLNVGGPARQLPSLGRELSRHGFESILLAGEEGLREGSLAPPWVVRVPGLRRRPGPADARALRALSRTFRSGRPQVVHTHMAKAGALGRIAARRAGVPVVVHTFHGSVLDGYFPRPVARAIAAAERRLARSTDALIAVSAAVRDVLLERRIGRPEQWHVIPVGLELDALLAGSLPQAEARARLGLGREGPLVGIVGRLVSVKDHRTFLRAAAQLAARRPAVRFVVAGDGPLRESLRREAQALLGERIRFLGWVLELEALYSALDLVVLTSRNEGTPLALVEAGAAGVPAVATRVGGVPDIVRDGATGLLAPVGDAAAIAGMVAALLDDPACARAMGAAARDWVRDRFSIRRLACDHADLYRELLDRKEAGS